VKSRLNKSLIRLQTSFRKTRDEDIREATLMSHWKHRWYQRQHQISRRLELIEAQLERLIQREDPIPSFSVVGIPDDTDEMTLMGSQ